MTDPGGSRVLRRSSGPRRRGRIITLFAILSLALGIAGNVVVFSLIKPSLLEPLPYPEPERIVLLGQRGADQPDLSILSLLSSFRVWADYKERSETLTEWAALNLEHMSIALGDRSLSLMIGSTTASFFRVLGAVPLHGRLFTDGESVEGGARVAVLDWDYWQTAHGGDPDVLGSVLILDGNPYEVIGILPEGFGFITPQVQIWVPLHRDPYAFSRSQRFTMSIARMVPGATMAQVNAEVAQIAENIERENPETFRGWTMDAVNLRTEFPDRHTTLYLRIILGSVLFVLLIVCANITNLLLARNQDRRREIALRTALGASRFRIFRRLIRESLVMAIVGGIGGLALATLVMRVTSERMGEWMPRLWHPSLDVDVALFTVGTTVLCGLVFGLFPAIQSLRENQVDALKEGGGSGSGGGRRRGQVSAGLVVAQIALSLVALGGGSLLTQGFLELMNLDAGFETGTLLTANIELPYWKYGTDDEVLLRYDDLLEGARALPGVESAALVLPLPRDLMASPFPYDLDSRPLPEGVEKPKAIVVNATPGYLETLGVPILQGHFIQDSDRPGAPPVAVINRTLAERRFQDRDPIGEHLTIWSDSREIVGVVADMRQTLFPRLGGGTEEAIYISLLHSVPRSPYLTLRTRGDPLTLAEPVRRMIWGLDPDIPIHTLETLDQFTRRYAGVTEVFNWILGAFGILALLLASLGTYGVVAYSVGQRTHEVGVRLAVGARPQEVVGMIARQGLWMSIVGIAIGALLLIPVVATIGNVLAGMGLAGMDPLTLVVVIATLFIVTLVASIVPATRAATVDPVRVLKAE